MRLQTFRQKMADHGLDPGEIVTDGAVHRFPTWGDSVNETSGAYWHNGTVGWFQDWRTMEKPVTVKGKLSKADQAALNGSFQGANNMVSQEALVAGTRRIWKAGTEPDGHPYLKKKGVKAPPEVKQHDGCLIIPVLGVNNKLNGLQRIDGNGRKRFLTGTRKKGSMFGIKGNGTYIICEGFSTGVSLHEATGASIAVAFDAGNLVHVAKEISKKVNPQNIIIAGDNDITNEKNIGAEMAEKAAKEIGCSVVLPEFKEPDGKGTTDFNDLHIVEGAEVVKAQVELAVKQVNLEDEIKGIADLSLLQREVEVTRIAKEHQIPKGVINKYLKGLYKDEENKISEILKEVEPSEHPVNGADLLNSIMNRLTKHVILPDGAVAPIATWTLLTYCYDAFWICPILGVVSPLKRCGKTTLLEVILGMVNKGLPASNITSAVVFRVIEKYKPALLIDEADTFLKFNQELRGVVNSGHSKGSAFALRSEGNNHEPTPFSTWGPKAIAMIGKSLPNTLQDRSVVIHLKRKTSSEIISRLDLDSEAECIDIRRKCQRWADDNMDKLSTTRPDMPKTNNDRMTDNWMPLFAIAQVVGGDWPELIKKSLLTMMEIIDDDETEITLLEDIREIFDADFSGRIFSRNLVEALKSKSESPWDDWSNGKGFFRMLLSETSPPPPLKAYQRTKAIISMT